jgi:hypothetical protein
MNRGVLTIGSLLALVFVGVSLRGGEAPLVFFPLETGRVWRYTGTGDPPVPVYWEIMVLAKDADITLVRYQFICLSTNPPSFGDATHPLDIRLQGDGNALNIELEGEGFVPFYRFEEESFVHRDFDICNDNLPVRVLPAGDVVVPAGSFSDCLVIIYDRSNCADAGKFSETWCPGVGLVHWYEDSFGGGAEWFLTAFQPAPKPFRRGDANTDSRVDISDAVATLRVLFLGEGYLACDDAADSNDDGRLDISDAIFTLLALFTGGLDIPAPGAETCGFDSTADEIHCASFPPCFERIGD